MNVLHVTPHLPPYQAANALLPDLLGRALETRGFKSRFLSFGEERDTERVRRVRRRSRRLGVTRVPQALEAFDTWRKGRSLIEASDVLHVHSNTWVNQIVARMASRRRKPYVLTHYGTEIWHHDGKDPRFRRLNRDAEHVTFYSQALLERGRSLAVPMRRASVVYPPVPETFHRRSSEERSGLRARFDANPLLLNVKRLHPLADHATLLRAFKLVKEALPDAGLVIAGTGEEAERLEALRRELALGPAVTFRGLVPNEEVSELQAAADLFVLSSALEATPTVVLEALASGTPVVSTDNPGGVELAGLFPDDVSVVPRKDPAALASAIVGFCRRSRRAGDATEKTIADRFRVDGVVDRYAELYREATGS